MKPRSLLAVGSLAVVIVAGCGQKSLPQQKVYPARGTVTLKGKPICLGQIELTPVVPGQGANASGVIDQNGAFALRTYSNGPTPDGAAPGKYNVTVTNYNSTESGPLPKGVTPTKVPARYSAADSSGATVEIKSGDNDLTIDLK
jgi:hypothetical protein